MNAPASNTIFVAVGNPFRGDDGAGTAILRHLRKDIPAGVTVLEETGDGVELFEVWKGVNAVILVGAVQSGAPPGTIHRFDAAAEKLPSWFSHSSPHTFGVAEAIELARSMGELPPRLIVYGIEGLDFSAGTELSPEVAEIVGAASRFILQEICHQSAAASAVPS